MKLRLKKAYNDFSRSLSAGAIKTVEEWTKIFPNLWGADITATMPEWFEQVAGIQLTVKAYLHGAKVEPYLNSKFKYDGKMIDAFYMDAKLLENQEDVKELIEALQILKHSFVQPTMIRRNPATVDECYNRKIKDRIGK